MKTKIEFKPEILTESDLILEKLQNEMDSIKERMHQLEKENQETKEIKANFNKQLKINQNLIQSKNKQAIETRQDFQVAAKLVRGFKNPVNQVVNSLKDMKNEIVDEDLQKTLEDCVKTANQVLASFDKTESYCLSLGSAAFDKFEVINFKEYIKKKIAGSKFEQSTKILCDKNLPDKIKIPVKLVEKTIDTVIAVLLKHNGTDQRLQFKITQKNAAINLGIQAQQLEVNISSNKTTYMKWKENWLDSVDLMGDNDGKAPLEWLQCRNELKKINGDLKVLLEKNFIVGTELSIPCE